MSLDPRIEAHYVFSDRYPERREVYDSIDRFSRRARLDLRSRLDIPYGPASLEKLDLFFGAEGGPLLVYIHGGYWRSMDKHSFSYVARPLVQLGYTVAVLNYPLAPQVKLARIVASIGRALDWLAGPGAAQLPGCSTTVLAGHSAGGHLAAYAAGERRLAGGIAGCVGVSGIFDLEPLMKTSLAARIELTYADVETLSPITRAPFDGWMLLIVGEDETEGFVEAQTWRFASMRIGAGHATDVLLLSGTNHYTILSALAGQAPLVREIDARVRRQAPMVR